MYFCDLFLSSSSVFQETCQPKQLIYAIKQSSIGLKSVHYLGGKLWNAMPIEFQNAPSKSSFKTKLDTYWMRLTNEPNLLYLTNKFIITKLVTFHHSIKGGALSLISLLGIERATPLSNFLYTIYLLPLAFLYCKNFSCTVVLLSVALLPV